jgi:hypothetical protein
MLSVGSAFRFLVMRRQILGKRKRGDNHDGAAAVRMDHVRTCERSLSLMQRGMIFHLTPE